MNTADRVLPGKWSSRALLGRGPLVLSFDIFGFALEPAVLEADDVHRLVASHLGDELGDESDRGGCYVALRRLAEDLARDASNRSGGGPVVAMPAVREQLVDILRPAATTPSDVRLAREAIRREIDLQRALWRPNPVAHDLYCDAVAAGITVAFLADSPLPRDLVTRVLGEAGYRDGPVLVSSQEGTTKVSGELFATLRDRVGVDPERITHLGPDGGTVLERAAEAGLQVWPVARRRASVLGHIVTGLVERSGVDAVALALAADRMAAAVPDVSLIDIGYYAGGPLATGFCAWTGRVIAATEPDHVLFCGPSGRLLRQVTSIVRPDIGETSMHELDSRDDGQPAMETVARLVRDLDLRDGGRLLAVGLGWGDQPHRWLADGAAGCGIMLDIVATYLGVATPPEEDDPIRVWAFTGSPNCPLTAVAGDRLAELSALLPSPQADLVSNDQKRPAAEHDLAAGVIEFAEDVAPWLTQLPDDTTRALTEPALRLLDSPTVEEAALLGAEAGGRTTTSTSSAGGQPISRWRRRPPARLRSRPPS